MILPAGLAANSRSGVVSDQEDPDPIKSGTELVRSMSAYYSS